MKLKPTERDKFLTVAEFKKLLLASAGSSRDFMLLYLGGALGLRISEAVSLERGCFARLKENFVEVTTLKQRGRPVRSVAIDDDTRSLVEEYLCDYIPAEQRWLFLSQRRPSCPLTARAAAMMFKAYAAKAGLNPRYSFHALRHYRGLKIWKQTRDLKQVQEALRHSSMRTSEVYVHLSDEDKVEAAKKVKAL